MTKHYIFTIFATLIFTQACTTHSQNPTIPVDTNPSLIPGTPKISRSDSIPVHTFTDPRDGQSYKIITFKSAQTGTSITWMAQNLNYKTESSYAYYEQDSNRAAFGLLYTWEAAKKACPQGWHVATDEEWSMLVNQFGGAEKAARALKSTKGWQESGNGTNSSGFNALPGGQRKPGGSYINLGGLGFWWTSSPAGEKTAWGWDMHFGGHENDKPLKSKVFRFPVDVLGGSSVRCVRD